MKAFMITVFILSVCLSVVVVVAGAVGSSQMSNECEDVDCE